MEKHLSTGEWSSERNFHDQNIDSLFKCMIEMSSAEMITLVMLLSILSNLLRTALQQEKVCSLPRSIIKSIFNPISLYK